MAGSGRPALADEIAKAEETLNQQHQEAQTGKSAKKRGRPKKVDKEALAADLVLCEYLIGLPFDLSGTVGAHALPAVHRAGFKEIWELSGHERKIGGKALHILALRYGDLWAKYLPHLVLGAVLVGGYGARLAMSLRIIRAVRRGARDLRGRNAVADPHLEDFEGAHP